MKEEKVLLEKGSQLDSAEARCRKAKKTRRKWEKPTLLDVSEKVMAQPYIRFT